MRNEIAAGEKSVRLEPKAVEVLAYLAARPGAVVSREELLAAVWPGVVVGDEVLTQAIIKLRKAMGDDAHRPQYIETISKRGYRLIAQVTPAGEGTAASPPPMQAASTPPSKRLWAGVALVLVLVAVAAGIFAARGNWPRMPWPIQADARGDTRSAPLVAVLPLANLSGDPGREYFSEGITEDIIAGLSRFSGLRVMSHAAVQGFKGNAPSPGVIEAELGARYIVSGSVREADGKVRVSVALSDARKGELLWSERHDGEGLGLFEVQDRIVRGVVTALHVRLNDFERRRTFSRPTESLEAHDLVLRARSLLYRHDRRTNREAREMLVRAQQIAPEYGEAVITLGEAEVQRALYGWVQDPAGAMKLAEGLARRVLASSDTRSHARAHSLLGRIYSNLAMPDDAMRHADLALAANPSDADALYRRAAALLQLGHIADSIAAHESAQRFQPRVGPGFGANFVGAYYAGERYQEALSLADAIIAEFPSDVSLHALRAAALSQLGRQEEARAAIEQVKRLSPGAEARHFGTRFKHENHAEHLREALRKSGLD